MFLVFAVLLLSALLVLSGSTALLLVTLTLVRLALLLLTVRVMLARALLVLAFSRILLGLVRFVVHWYFSSEFMIQTDTV
ncbi:MAG: hypothetical protein WDO73_15170 [Ignavibacteriota bacterium]